MLIQIVLLLCLSLTQADPFCRSPDIFEINLDLPVEKRYTDVSEQRKLQITNFIDYLKASEFKYRVAFSLLSLLPNMLLRSAVGEQFYGQCESVARGINRPVSEVVVFNYMYELGAYKKFCTSIPVSVSGDNGEIQECYLARNLDYGYQQFLANNSIRLHYFHNGVMVFESIGHAGLIGSHTALRLKQPGNNLQYSITLNERSQGGFRDTLYAMLTSHCETAPYVVMRTLRQAHNTLQELINSLRAANNCAGVYLIVSANGQSIVVEKDRGKGAGLVYPDTQVAMLDEGVLRYTVKTNYDLKEPDEDGRMGAATAKLRQAIVEKGLITQDDVWQILEEAPNFNNLTLMTAILDTISGKSRVCIWETE